MPADFRQYLFPHDHPRLAEVRGMDPYAYRTAAQVDGTFTGNLIKRWKPLYCNTFSGITENGSLREGIHRFEEPRPGEEAPVAEMVKAADDLLAALDDASRKRIRYAVDAVEWQTWANPEFMQFDTGLRLEIQSVKVREKALALMAASLSVRGYELVRTVMRINGFLGEVVGLQSIMNEYSYNFALYGDPHVNEPWGWQLYGHHWPKAFHIHTVLRTPHGNDYGRAHVRAWQSR